MFDSTVHAATIARQIRKSDFSSNLWVFTPADREDAIQEALRIARNGFANPSLRQSVLRGKAVYRQSSLPEQLLTRHASEAVKRITRVRQSDRQSIIKSLRRLWSEGSAFNALQFDVRSFYESIDPTWIISRLRTDPAFSRQSVDIIESFFEALARRNIPGLPRGIGLSATLSEYLMRHFDRAMADTDGVRFYRRYVDDIMIVSSEYVDPLVIQHTARAELPVGLTFGRAKSRIHQLSKAHVGNPHGVTTTFNYLGYQFSVSPIIKAQQKWYRDVHVDISPKKVKTIKRRICLAFLQYKSDGMYIDLLDRIKLLTSNTWFNDEQTGRTRLSGLRYNYHQIDASSSRALLELDRFLVNLLCSAHPGNRLRPAVSNLQRRQLLGLGFSSGFHDNRFFKFDETRLGQLVRCWSHA